MDVLAHRLGLPEPAPHLLVANAPDAPQAVDLVSSRLGENFNIRDYSHIGGIGERERGGIVVVVALSRRRLTLRAVPRRLEGPGTIRIEGRVADGYVRPELAHTRPDGRIGMEPLGEGPAFGRSVTFAEQGRHRLEILAQGPDGPSVLANFPVFVGVPVDETAAAGTSRGRAVPPDEVRDTLLGLINADRARAGLGPLAVDPELDEVALRHSEDMRDHGFVAHVSPTEGSTETRLARAGLVTPLAAENVGKGYGAEELHQGFMDSPGHRGAVLLAGATHVGIGVAAKKEGGLTTYYATEIFIRRIPPLPGGAKVDLLKDINGLRAAAGRGRLAEDFDLTRLAETAARGFLLDASIGKDEALRELVRQLEKTYKRPTRFEVVMSIVGSLEEGAKQASADARLDKARWIGLGLAQGDRRGYPPNSIVLVLVFSD